LKKEGKKGKLGEKDKYCIDYATKEREQ